MTILKTIVGYKREEVEARKGKTTLQTLRKRLPGAPVARDFRAALLNPALPAPRVIAEVKRRSPSKGILRLDLNPVDLARTYQLNGAAAVSVLADSRFFGGSLEDVRAVSSAIDVPVLCKEFIVDPYQLYEARLAGADAILLIAGILATVEMRELRQLAAGLGMASLVEVHDRAELGAALASGAEIIGINNRDLHTFTVSLDTTRDLRPLIPANIVTVSESGISSAAHRSYLASIDIEALLIGESLITASDEARATREICGLSISVLEESLR
jgi:indole-3-glycerol phosphate synthase